MPEGAAGFEQSTINSPTDRDRRHATDLRGLFDFVTDARQRFFRSVPILNDRVCTHERKLRPPRPGSINAVPGYFSLRRFFVLESPYFPAMS